MHHTFFALVAHGDVDKFDFEDGVVREATQELLATESSIRHVLVDNATAGSLELDVDHSPCEWDGSVLISSEDSKDAELERIGALVSRVALVRDSWSCKVFEVSDLDSTWVGTATPGPKVSFVLKPAAGIDSASFETWITETLRESVTNSPGVGCRAITPADDSSTDAIVSMWFPNVTALNNATSSDLFSSIVTSPLLDETTIRTLTTVEHRLAPNPNAWEMPAES